MGVGIIKLLTYMEFLATRKQAIGVRAFADHLHSHSESFCFRNPDLTARRTLKVLNEAGVLVCENEADCEKQKNVERRYFVDRDYVRTHILGRTGRLNLPVTAGVPGCKLLDALALLAWFARRGEEGASANELAAHLAHGSRQKARRAIRVLYNAKYLNVAGRYCSITERAACFKIDTAYVAQRLLPSPRGPVVAANTNEPVRGRAA